MREQCILGHIITYRNYLLNSDDVVQIVNDGPSKTTLERFNDDDYMAVVR